MSDTENEGSGRSIRARVMRTRAVAAGSPVGYGGRWTAPRATRVAIVGMGYADGLPFGLGGQGASVLIQGRRCPIVGSVMMDYALVDVGHLQQPPLLCRPVRGWARQLPGAGQAAERGRGRQEDRPGSEGAARAQSVQCLVPRLPPGGRR